MRTVKEKEADLETIREANRVFENAQAIYVRELDKIEDAICEEGDKARKIVEDSDDSFERFKREQACKKADLTEEWIRAGNEGETVLREVLGIPS